jgi:hypothetical protein
MTKVRNFIREIQLIIYGEVVHHFFIKHGRPPIAKWASR